MEFSTIDLRSLEWHRNKVADEIQTYRGPYEPALNLNDPFLLTSVFQKALRRSERRFVFGAGRRLLSLDPQRLWRRLVICAVEDFGLADISLTAQIVAAAASKGLRAKLGGDERVLCFILERLLATPCDRRLDHLYMIADAIHRGLIPRPIREDNSFKDIEALLDEASTLIGHCERNVPERSFRAVLASRCDEALHKMASQGLLDEPALELCLQARRLSRSLLPVLLPLAKDATEKSGGGSSIESRELPPTLSIGAIPSYALDGHTRAGRAVLERFLCENTRIRTLLWDIPTNKRKIDALASLLFLIEGGLCAREITDPLVRELRARSRGCLTGIPSYRIADTIRAMHEAMPVIERLRALFPARGCMT